MTYLEPLDDADIPISSSYVPDVGFVGVQGSSNINTDGSSKRSSPVNLNLKQVGDVLFALGQALKVASIPVTLASDQGTLPVLDTNSASNNTHLAAIDTATSDLVADLDALITNTTGLATQATLASAKTDLDTLAGIVSGSKGAVKAGAGDFADLATLLTLSGTPTDANTVASLMGRLTKIKDLLAATLTVQGTITEANSAASKADLDTIVTNTNKIPASPATEGGHLATIDTSTAASKTDLDTIATNTTGLATQTTLASILTNLALGQKTKSASLPFTLASDQGDIPVKGDFTEQASLTAGSLNADLVPSTDVSAYKWFSIHTNTNAFVGTMTIQGSNDNANWVSILANQPNNAGALSASITATNTLYVGIVAYRFLRVRMTAYTSGTAQATLELYTSSSSLITMGATQQGTWTVQPGNTANTTPWLVNASQIGGQAPKLDNTNELGVSLYGKNSAAGDTPIKVNSSGDQYVLGDFTEQAALSAGSLNADLVASTDVSAYKFWSLQVTGAFVGTLSFQGSNDGVNFVSTYADQSSANFNIINSTTGTGLFWGAVNFRYLRIRMTSYTSGTANGVAELYTSPSAFHVIGAQAFLGAGSNSIGTVQPGNTPNTTPWLESIHDGTNKANVLASTSVSNAIGSQGALLTGGAFAEQASLTAGSLNADLVASTDVSNYKWLSLHINANAYSGTLTFQVSNDNAVFAPINLTDASSVGSSSSTTSSTNIVYHGPIFFRYFRVRMTSYTSGTAQGTLELYTFPAGIQGTRASQQGTWTVQPGNTQNTTPWLVAGPNNNATQAANTAGNVVVKGSAGYLHSAVVTTTGTAQLDIYDNASTNSGTKILSIPANAAVGTIYAFTGGARANNGITSNGVSNCPGVTFNYS